MSPRHLFACCLLLSFFLHCWLLNQKWEIGEQVEGGQIIVPVNFDVAAGQKKNGLVLKQGVVEESQAEGCEEATERLKREAMKYFLAQVQEAIEKRKFRWNGDLSRTIGNVKFTFRIRPDNTFSDIRMIRSSGDNTLDRAAEHAIATASGKTKRPKIIGDRVIGMTVTVKYQYAM